ncbi:hypothetical protein ABFA25_07355 [Mycobacterium lepromatosis]
MMAGQLLVASATTGHILIATQLGEHDLVVMMGDRYRQSPEQRADIVALKTLVTPGRPPQRLVKD